MSNYPYSWDEEKAQGKARPAMAAMKSFINGSIVCHKQAAIAESFEDTKLRTACRNFETLISGDEYSPRVTGLSSSSNESKEKDTTKIKQSRSKSRIARFSFRVRLQRSLPRLKSILFFRRPTVQEHGKHCKSNLLLSSTKKPSKNVGPGPSKDAKNINTPTHKPPQGHRRGASSSTKSTTATRKRTSHKRNISGSTWASSTNKQLPTIPDDFSKFLTKERPPSSIYSAPANDVTSPPIGEIDAASHSEPCLRPESNTVLLMQGQNPFEGEWNLTLSGVEEAPEQDRSVRVHFRDQPSIVSPPAHFQSTYLHPDESASTTTIKPPSPLHPARPSQDSAQSPRDQDLNTAFIALKRENADLRNSITKLASLQDEIESRMSPKLTNLETENMHLRQALSHAESQRNALSASMSSLLISPTSSQVSLPFSAPPTPIPSIPARATPPPARSSSLGPERPRSTGQPQRQPQLPQPPLTAEVTIPDVDRLLHPAAKAKYYATTNPRLPEPWRLAEALSRQEDDLEKNREYMQKVRAKVVRAEEDMDAGIEEVRAAKRMLGVRAKRGLGAIV